MHPLSIKCNFKYVNTKNDVKYTLFLNEILAFKSIYSQAHVH